MPAVHARQRPALARDDPLDVLGDQRQQTLVVAAADRREDVSYDLNVPFKAHRVHPSMRQHTHWRWHLDEVYVKINGQMHYLWRAVDHEGEVLESFVTKDRDKAAALTFIKKALKRHGSPKAITTDGLRSYGAAMKELGDLDKREVGRWANNRMENSHQPSRRRERAMLRFRQMKTLQQFASVHATFHNHFNQERPPRQPRRPTEKRRSAALAEWRANRELASRPG